MFTWEVPFFGWAFVTARTAPSLLLPPIVGIIDHGENGPDGYSPRRWSSGSWIPHPVTTTSPPGQSTATETPR